MSLSSRACSFFFRGVHPCVRLLINVYSATERSKGAGCVCAAINSADLDMVSICLMRMSQIRLRSLHYADCRAIRMRLCSINRLYRTQKQLASQTIIFLEERYFLEYEVAVWLFVRIDVSEALCPVRRDLSSHWELGGHSIFAMKKGRNFLPKRRFLQRATWRRHTSNDNILHCYRRDNTKSYINYFHHEDGNLNIYLWLGERSFILSQLYPSHRKHCAPRWKLVTNPCKIYPRNRPWRPTELWDVKDATLSRKSAQRWRRCCQPNEPAAWSLNKCGYATHIAYRRVTWDEHSQNIFLRRNFTQTNILDR
jgi:hypothetical protein